MSNISVFKGDITTVEADAIVNAANNRMRGGGGVDGAIHAAGGPAILSDCIERFPNGLATGDAGWTTGGDLRARWVIHTIGPNFNAGQTDRSQLTSCYRRSLQVADELGAESVAFPLISAGIYGWPKDDAIAAAIETLSGTPTRVEELQIVAFDQRTFEEISLALARSTPRRILEGVRALHERGYHEIRVLPGMSPSGMHWRVSIARRSNQLVDDGYLGLRDWDAAINYTTGAGIEFAGSFVTPTTTADDVADMILAALPGLKPAADDAEYVAWYAGLLRLMGARPNPDGPLPIAYADYFDEREGWEIGWGSGVRYPHPPSG